jgi:hypothetical protein
MPNSSKSKGRNAILGDADGVAILEGTMREPPSFETFCLQAQTLGLRADPAELAEIYGAYRELLLLLARVHAHPGASGPDWPQSIHEAWEA